MLVILACTAGLNSVRLSIQQGQIMMEAERSVENDDTRVVHNMLSIQSLHCGCRQRYKSRHPTALVS